MELALSLIGNTNKLSSLFHPNGQEPPLRSCATGSRPPSPGAVHVHLKYTAAFVLRPPWTRMLETPTDWVAVGGPPWTTTRTGAVDRWAALDHLRSGPPPRPNLVLSFLPCIGLPCKNSLLSFRGRPHRMKERAGDAHLRDGFHLDDSRALMVCHWSEETHGG